jgi:hypothetical protein
MHQSRISSLSSQVRLQSLVHSIPRMNNWNALKPGASGVYGFGSVCIYTLQYLSCLSFRSYYSWAWCHGLYLLTKQPRYCVVVARDGIVSRLSTHHGWRWEHRTRTITLAYLKEHRRIQTPVLEYPKSFKIISNSLHLNTSVLISNHPIFHSL